MPRNRVSGPLALFALITVAGCGGGDGAEVTGKVTISGKPLEAGKVTFYDPSRPGRNVIADIRPDGSYRAVACPYGQVKVTVQPMPPKPKTPPKTEVHAGGSKAAVAPPAPRTPAAAVPAINPKYSDPATTDLVCPVTGSTQTFDIDLQP